MTFHEAGDSAFLIELGATIDPAVNARAIAVAEAVRAAALAGVRDVVSTYCSVAIYVDPFVASRHEIELVAHRAENIPVQPRVGKLVEVPVVYEGPDLDAVAERAGLTRDVVIERHAASEYRVYLLGFLPGFAYLGLVDPSIATPRRPTPRASVPAGAVGIADRQTGIYPCQSPGGWQIIGYTAVRVFDPAQNPPALFAPGDRVRFCRADRVTLAHRQPRDPSNPSPAIEGEAMITVLDPGMMTSVQDLGRWGYQGLGVSVAGALDAVSHRRANALVGNAPSAASIEATIRGPELRFEQRASVAVTGADLSPTLDGVALAMNQRTECRAGSVLRLAGRVHGARSYIAVAGGIALPPVLGSRSAHALTGIGGGLLRPGDRLPVGTETGAPVRTRPAGAPVVPAPERPGVTRLRILPGPQAGCFSPDSLNLLQRTRFEVSPQSNRMGYRLTGGTVQARRQTMISDATFTGAIQIPPAGEPILLMADRQTVGGYPQIAIVISADLPRAAQLVPGDRLEFVMCSRAEALAALRDQETSLAG